jgi:hypothetical protein
MFLMFLCIAFPAAAQQVATSDDPVANARFKFGVIGVDPRFGIQNAGVDTNVFNATVNEQQDFTFTVVPATQLFMRTGKGLLSVDGGLEFVYFHEFDRERSVNSSISAQYELRFNRIRPYLSIGSLNTRQRPGYEIDVRARHYETDIHAGGDLRVASKSSIRFDVRHLEYSFNGDEVFNGRPLNQELNRELEAVEVGWRQRLTALTTWVARITRESERFEFDPVRNSDSFRFNTGFELGRLALIRGSAYAGYRKLTPADGGLFPEFSGVTSDVDVSYTAPTQTRLGVVVKRDIQYSYERRTPYYVQTGWTALLTQRVIGRWDVQLSGGRDRLSYQAVDERDRRTDFVGRFGGGVGYALGDQTRASFDVQSFYRSSDDPGREYGGIRAGVSVNYGY